MKSLQGDDGHNTEFYQMFEELVSRLLNLIQRGRESSYKARITLLAKLGKDGTRKQLPSSAIRLLQKYTLYF